MAGLVLDSVFITDQRRNSDPMDSRHEDYSAGHAVEKTALNTYFRLFKCVARN